MKQYSISVHKTSNTNKIIPDHDLENLVSIFVNDEIATEDEDYFIKDNKIVFNRELNDSDDIKMNYSYDTNKNIISKGKINKNSILSRFDSNIKLNENNKYRIGIVIDKELYEWEFNSKQNPMFSTARQTLEDIGEFIEGFTEEYINNKIYDNSLAVIDLIDELASLDTPVENVTYEKDEDGFYTTTYKAVKNWVRYKTDIDLTLARYFGISYHYGSEMKEIGDIKIEKSTKLPYIDNLLDFLKKQWDEADKVIRGTNVVSSAVKAGTKYKYDDWDRDTTW
jgi:hypothetical protein